jgi:hypothetical protein
VSSRDKAGRDFARAYIERAFARLRHEKELTEAWKNPPRLKSSLAVLIQDPDCPPKEIAVLLRRLCGPRRVGKPGGWHLRWRRPHYLAARLIESRPPSERTDNLITDAIRTINGWAFMRGRQPLDAAVGSRDFERVRTLLRGSKARRL